jgi:hypothetical protein
MLITYLRLASRLEMSGAIPPFSLYSFVTWTVTTLRLFNYYFYYLAESVATDGRWIRVLKWTFWSTLKHDFIVRLKGRRKSTDISRNNGQCSVEPWAWYVRNRCLLWSGIKVVCANSIRIELLLHSFFNFGTRWMWVASFIPERAHNIHWLGSFPCRGSNRDSSVIS